MVYVILDWQQYHQNVASYVLLLASQLSYNIFWCEISSSATVSILLSHHLSINSFFWTPFLFLQSFTNQLDFCLLACLIHAQAWIFSFIVHLVCEFLFLVLFWVLWKLVTVKKLKHGKKWFLFLYSPLYLRNL